MGLLPAAGEVHDADHLMRRIGLDEHAAGGAKGRRRVAEHPVAVGRQKIDGCAFGAPSARA